LTADLDYIRELRDIFLEKESGYTLVILQSKPIG